MRAFYQLNYTPNSWGETLRFLSQLFSLIGVAPYSDHIGTAATNLYGNKRFIYCIVTLFVKKWDKFPARTARTKEDSYVIN